MPTWLPQNDPDPSRRQADLARARARYGYTWHQPEGVATASAVPEGESFSAGALLRYGGVQAKLKAHLAVKGTGQRIAAADDAARGAGEGQGEAEAGGWLARVARGVRGGLDARERRATPEVARSWFGDHPPALVRQRAEHPEQADLLFAWQRLGGANPMALRALAEDGADLAVTPAHFAAAMNSAGLRDDLAAARAEGRLFVADWRFLAGARTGRTERGERKRVDPALAVFAQHPGGLFLPVAVRCAPGEPVFTPADGVAWTMAKLAAQTADTHEQALVWHLGRCHFVAEALALASARQLAGAHPVRRLLAPHFQFTLAINAQVRDTLMKPGGDLEAMLATTLGQSLWAVADSVRRFDYARALPPADIAARGLGDARRLHHCPIRDDGGDVWRAVRDFVGAYLELYYAADGDVAGDPEVRGFCDELGAHWGGRLRGVPEVATRAALADLVSFAIWTAGPMHTVCNYSQFEHLSDSSDMPVALLGERPRPGAGADELRANYLTEDLSMTQYGFFYEQTQLDENHLGRYPAGAFDDSRVAPVVAAFERALAAVDARIDARNAARPCPYEWLRPHHTRASIHS